MDDSTIFDDTLLSILKECKTLPNFLDKVFGFLKRRTDFYCIATEPKSPVGLPTGWAEHFVKDAFFKWKPKDENTDVQENIPEATSQVIEDDIVNMSVANEVHFELDKSSNNETELESTALRSFTTSESYNGAVFDIYTWSQNITDIDIIVNLPENINSRNMSVSILPQKLTITLKGSNVVLLDGELCQKVKHNDAIWSLDKRKLEIHLEKISEMWWDCLVKSEPRLDVSKIDCTRPFEELPEEAQAKIEELTWNQERKRLGLPTSNEMVLQEKLKKAWDVEGSPFKGPFDPNTVIVHT